MVYTLGCKLKIFSILPMMIKKHAKFITLNEKKTSKRKMGVKKKKMLVYEHLIIFSREGLIRYMMSDENAPVYLERLDIYQVI